MKKKLNNKFVRKVKREMRKKKMDRYKHCPYFIEKN